MVRNDTFGGWGPLPRCVLCGKGGEGRKAHRRTASFLAWPPPQSELASLIPKPAVETKAPKNPPGATILQQANEARIAVYNVPKNRVGAKKSTTLPAPAKFSPEEAAPVSHNFCFTECKRGLARQGRAHHPCRTIFPPCTNRDASLACWEREPAVSWAWPRALQRNPSAGSVPVAWWGAEGWTGWRICTVCMTVQEHPPPKENGARTRGPTDTHNLARFRVAE